MPACAIGYGSCFPECPGGPMTAVLPVAPTPVSHPAPLTLPSLFGRVVLLATDGSPASNAAARTASTLAARSGEIGRAHV